MGPMALNHRLHPRRGKSSAHRAGSTNLTWLASLASRATGRGGRGGRGWTGARPARVVRNFCETHWQRYAVACI